MSRIEELYSFIDAYIEEHDLPNARISIRLARKYLEGVVRKSRNFDRKGVLGQTYFEHCLFVTKLLIDLNIQLSHDETDIIIASGLCHDMIAHAGFKRQGLELTDEYCLNPRIYEIVRVTTKIGVRTEADLKKFYEELRYNKLAVLIAMADRSNLVENVYALSITEALSYIREIRDHALPVCVYALEHYPDIRLPVKLLADKVHNLIDVTDIISRRYQEKEHTYKKEILALREANANLRGMIAGMLEAAEDST